MLRFGRASARRSDDLERRSRRAAVRLLTPWIAALVTSSTWAQQAAPAAAVHFEIKAFQVKGNTILTPAEVEDAVYAYTGPDRTPDDVEAARAALQAAYETRGYSTVLVVIPEQSVESGFIRLEVEPQKIGKVVVNGAHDEARIRREAPSLAEGGVPNLHDVQRDVVALNRMAHRRVTPEFVPSEGGRALDVELRVEERPPLRATFEINNRASPSTSELRASAALRYDDLWARGDSVGVSVQTAPERTEDGTVYSANYVARLSSSLQMLVYGVRSDSDISVVDGLNVVGAGDLVGVRLLATLPSSGKTYYSATVGIDYKSFDEDVTLGADREAVPITYWPATLSWRADWVGDDVRADLTLSTTFGLAGLGDDRTVFDNKRYQARPSFFVLRPEGSRTQTWANDWQWWTRFAGQWSEDALISNQQFGLGGVDSVRGYFESEVMGDYGAALQLELRTPSFARPLGDWADEMRLLAFADGGVSALRDALPGQEDHSHLASAGLGLRLRLLSYFNGALDLAVPLYDGPQEEKGSVNARFRFWGEF